MSRALLDTHCWLWAMQEPGRLNPSVRALLENPEAELYISAASAWEAAIKQSLGKLKLPESVEAYFASRIEEERFIELPISIRHAAKVGALPPHHRDPFDRILIAQSLCEGLPIITADPLFKQYGVKIIRAD